MKKTVAIILSIILMASLIACAPRQNDGEAELTTPSNALSIPTLPPSKNQTKSSEIRVAIRYETNMNPLYPKHYATRSLLALVYESLFEIGPEGEIVPVLAKSMDYNAETMTYTIVVNDQKSFHSGKKVTAHDISTSLLKMISIMTGHLPAISGTDKEEPPVIETEIGDGHANDSDEARTTEWQRPGGANSLFVDGSTFNARLFSGLALARQNEYRNISRVSTEGENTIQIELRNPDPDFAGLLTFPVIPQSNVNERSFNPISGSGPWRIVGTEGGKQLTLERVSPGSGISRIKARSYESVALAMKAYDDHELDLLVMNTAETALYADRTRIRKQRIDHPEFYSIYFRHSDQQAAIRERDYMIREIKLDPNGEFFSAPFKRSAFPLLAGDLRLVNTLVPEFNIQDLPALNLPDDVPEPTETGDNAGTPPVTTPDTRQPFVLLVPEGFTPDRLIHNIGACVARLGKRFVTVPVKSSDWAAKLRGRDYHAALLADVSNMFLDPIDYLEGLRAFGLVDWTSVADSDDVRIMREGRHLVSSVESNENSQYSERAYTQAVSRVFSKLPLIGLSIPETMVIYGRDVQGTLAGSWYTPYKNVEDLTVWRP